MINSPTPPPWNFYSWPTHFRIGNFNMNNYTVTKILKASFLRSKNKQITILKNIEKKQTENF